MTNLTRYENPEDQPRQLVQIDRTWYLLEGDRLTPVNTTPTTPTVDNGSADYLRLIAWVLAGFAGVLLVSRWLFPAAPPAPPAPVIVQPQPVQVNPGCVVFCDVNGGQR